jgi:hypothetical protein
MLPVDRAAFKIPENRNLTQPGKTRQNLPVAESPVFSTDFTAKSAQHDGFADQVSVASQIHPGI